MEIENKKAARAAASRIKMGALLSVVLFPLTLTACHKEGPAESAGKSLDNAAQKVQDAVDPPGPAEKAGRAIDNATK